MGEDNELNEAEDRIIALTNAIGVAVARLEEIDARDGGPAWHKAKELLGCDLHLILFDLNRALTNI